MYLTNLLYYWILKTSCRTQGSWSGCQIFLLQRVRISGSCTNTSLFALYSLYGFPKIFFRPCTLNFTLPIILMYFLGITYFLRWNVFKCTVHTYKTKMPTGGWCLSRVRIGKGEVVPVL